jgi:hypothetical protein
MPAQPTPQLDLFEHSRDTMLRNDVLDALQRRDADAATLAWHALADFEPRHEALPALAGLIAALESARNNTLFTVHAEAALASEQLSRSVTPVAQSQFGAAVAAAWLAPLWRGLANRAAVLPFSAAQAEDHAAALWLNVGDATAAIEAVKAVEGIESWRRIPAPLGWMALARYRSEGLDNIWQLLVELAWLAPQRFGQTARALADPLLKRLLRRFDEQFDLGDGQLADPLAWFPAWLLTEQPGLLPRLLGARTGQHSEPERGFGLVAELLGLERQGRHHELIAGRKRLRDVQPALYAAYMKTR